MPTTTPDPHEIVTVRLTPEQAEHVRDKLLTDFASDLEPLAAADPQAIEEVGEHVDTYRAKLNSLNERSYAVPRGELVQLANDLLDIGADRARDIHEAGGDEALVRERLRQLAPAFTAEAILAQLDYTLTEEARDLDELDAEVAALERDAVSAQRVTTVLRHEQHARDGRQLAQAWGHLADRIERDYGREA